VKVGAEPPVFALVHSMNRQTFVCVYDLRCSSLSGIGLRIVDTLRVYLAKGPCRRLPPQQILIECPRPHRHHRKKEVTR
jgi:hypothetical protein